MIISRTPLRVSFFGGGSDYPQWYHHHNGAVLASTIDKYCYVMLHNGQVWHTFDLPDKSGLGSSSAYTVGLLRACTEMDNCSIAKLATTWEFDKMAGSVGVQDQYLCAMGGFRHLRFDQHGLRESRLDGIDYELDEYLMLFDTHQCRRVGNIIGYQLAQITQHEALLNRMVQQVDEGITALRNNDYIAFGQLLEEAWQLKRGLSDYVTTPTIDAVHEAAMKAGAVGGKLLGGGGGGFMIFVVAPTRQRDVKEALGDLTHVPFKFGTEGTVVLYRD